jgi:hypothetical protein
MKSFLNSLVIALALVIGTASCQNEVAQIVNAATHAVPVANAGPSRIIQLPINTDTLRGTGTSANGPISGYLWSLVSGPNNPIIVSPSARTTAINNLVVGNYIFQFAVIDSAGYTGVDTVSVKVIAAITLPQQTLILQPSNNPEELVFAVQAGTNGSAVYPELFAMAWTNGGAPLTTRAAFKFNLSSIPPSATLLSAKLSLYTNPTPWNGDHVNANSGSNNAMWIRRLNSAWTLATPWASQPSTQVSTQVLIPHTSQSFLDLLDIDVKQMVDSMRTSGNYGMMIGLQNEVIYNCRNFGSSSHLDSTKHPKLVVVYQ